MSDKILSVTADFDERSERRRIIGKGDNQHAEHRFEIKGAGVIVEGLTSVELKMETTSRRIANLLKPGASALVTIEILEEGQ